MSDIDHPIGPVLLVLGILLVCLPMCRRDTSAGRILPCILCVALMIRTLIWRYANTLPEPSLSFECVWSYLFLCVETVSTISGLLMFLILARTKDRRAESRRHERWFGSVSPRVDIFIASYNEEESILDRTILGALSQDYDSFRVFLLDDGRRSWAKALCERRGVGYIARATNEHAKAGNMSHALRHLEQKDDASDFIAILDADFVTQPDFLRRAVALFHDPKVGCVQTPQHFFNPDPLQHGFRAGHLWPDEQRFFFDVLLAAKDAWGVAFSCGTSSICRREAVNAIGSFPVESVTEDMLLSIKMREKGWNTVYLNERLSMGLAPEGLQEYITQRGRWCLGFMQIMRGAWGPFSRGKLPLVDRISMIDAFFYWGNSFVFRFMCFLAPILYCWTGTLTLKATAAELVYFVGPSILAQICVSAWISNGRILPILADASQILIAADAIKATGIGLLKPQGHKFKVTAKGGDRSRTIIQWGIMRKFLVLLLVTIASIVVATQVPWSPAYGRDGAAIWLFWSYYNILVLVVTILTCVELPRLASERFRTAENAWLSSTGAVHRVRLTALSTVDALISGPAPAPEGSPVALALEGAGSVSGVITRGRPGFFEVGFTRDDAVHDALVRKLFSGRYRTAPDAIAFRDILQAIALRIIQ